MTKTRTETDTFGPVEVDDSRYWGAQAQRSLGNFKIGWEKQPLPIVRALGIVKRAAAETNMALGVLDRTIGEVIVKAAQEVIDGKLDDHFPLVVWQAHINDRRQNPFWNRAGRQSRVGCLDFVVDAGVDFDVGLNRRTAFLG